MTYFGLSALKKLPLVSVDIGIRCRDYKPSSTNLVSPTALLKGTTVMEFVRKTILGLVLVCGGLSTLYLLGIQAIHTWFNTTARTHVPSEVNGRLSAVAQPSVQQVSFSNVDSSITSPSNVPAGPTPANSDRIQGNTIAYWSTPFPETVEEVSELSKSQLVRLLLAVIVGGLGAGTAVYKFYPTIDRMKQKRRLKLALQRKRIRDDDDNLIACHLQMQSNELPVVKRENALTLQP
jgi:hypothetical protein